METADVAQKYNFDVVKWFSVVTVIYLVVGTLVGVYIAAELAWPALNTNQGATHLWRAFVER